MDLETFLLAAQAYSNLGSAIQDQLVAVVAGEAKEEQNPNALRHAAEFLRSRFARDIEGASDVATEITEYLEAPEDCEVE